VTKQIFISLIVFSLLLARTSFAKPLSGFHEGPYLLFSGGVLQYDWDQNQLTGLQEGGKWEPAVGFQFGWHTLDWFGLEVQTRYGTNATNNRREHIVTTNVGFSLTLLTDSLLDFEYWRILPFVRPSLAIAVAQLPADPAGNPAHVDPMGFGPGLSTGVHVMYKYLYFGLELQEDLISQPTQRQPGTNAIIFNGGWKDQFGLMTVVGVHY